MSERKRLIRFDWAMKYMLRDPSNFYIAEGFLSALLEEDITVQQILDSESNKDFANDKFTRVDVLIRDSKGRDVIIEIQQAYEPDYMYRVLYGTSKYIAQSIKSGESYRKIAKIVSVSIVYFNLGIGDDYLYHGKTHFIGKTKNDEIHQNTPFVKNLTLLKNTNFNKVAIYPEYYFIQIDKYQDEVKRTIDEWIYWFKNDKLREGSSSKHIDKVEEKLDMLHMSNNDRKHYDKYLENVAIDRNVLEGAIEEGMEKGMEKGIEKGMEKGIEKGKKEKSLEIAKSLKIAGINNEIIVQSTGLTIDEIEKI